MTIDTTGDVEFLAPDPEDLEALYREMLDLPGVRVVTVTAPIEPGDQGGGWDLLSAAVSGGAVTALIELIKSLAESRGSGFRLTVRRGRTRIELTGDDVERVLPELRDLLDDR
jgi:hypothetical protein